MLDDGTILLGKPNGMRSLWESGSHIGGPVFFLVEKTMYPNMSDQGEGEAKDKDETMEVQFQ